MIIPMRLQPYRISSGPQFVPRRNSSNPIRDCEPRLRPTSPWNGSRLRATFGDDGRHDGRQIRDGPPSVGRVTTPATEKFEGASSSTSGPVNRRPSTSTLGMHGDVSATDLPQLTSHGSSPLSSSSQSPASASDVRKAAGRPALTFQAVVELVQRARLKAKTWRERQQQPDIRALPTTSRHISIQHPAPAKTAPPDSIIRDEEVKVAGEGPPLAAIGALLLLSISYVHMATAGFALPAMLPSISSEMHLDDLQGALLTTGYR